MYNRILLKLSGEALSLGDGRSYDEGRVNAVADMLIALQKTGAQVGVVIGGGNIWRGRFSAEMNPANADQMGMLATIMNALCVEDALTRKGAKAKVFTAQEMNRFAALYTRGAALNAMQEGCIVLLSGGSGNPFFTTDTAAVLRAAELGADVVFKGTTVEGVFDSDPGKNPNAKLLRDITYKEAVDKQLHVMDITAFVLCQEQKVPELRVFSMADLNNILRVANGEPLGTRVHA